MQSADIAKLIFPRIDIIEMDALADEQMAKACNAHDLPSYADPANILALEDRPSGFAEIGSGRFNRAAAAIDALHENGAVPAPFLNIAHEVRVFHAACVEDRGHILKFLHGFERPPLFERVDRKSVVKGKRVSVRVDIGCRRIIKKKKT